VKVHEITQNYHYLLQLAALNIFSVFSNLYKCMLLILPIYNPVNRTHI